MTLDQVLPLQLLPAAALQSVRGVLTDIDDTLTQAGAIEPAALVALQQLAVAQVPVIAITGRPAGWSEPFAMAWPVAAIVAENGAVMLRRDGDALWRDFAQDKATRAAHFQRLQRCAQAVLAAVPGARLARDSAGRLTDIAIDHGEFAHLDTGQIDAVGAVMRSHGLNVSVSSIHINGWIGAHHKASGARWAVETVLGVPFDPAEWLFVGDSTNDQSMFEQVRLSVGVANLLHFADRLHTWPKYLATAERGAGFAQVAQALLAARAGA